MNPEEIPEAAQEKASGDHEHQRERQFTDDEDATGACALGRAVGAESFAAEGAGEVEAAGEPCGREAEEESGKH